MKTPLPPEAIAPCLHCRVTNNPVGTDAWCLGSPCSCDSCQYYRATKAELPAGSAIAALVQEALRLEQYVVNREWGIIANEAMSDIVTALHKLASLAARVPGLTEERDSFRQQLEAHIEMVVTLEKRLAELEAREVTPAPAAELVRNLRGWARMFANIALRPHYVLAQSTANELQTGLEEAAKAIEAALAAGKP